MDDAWNRAVRPGVRGGPDAPACGRILYAAFKDIADRHNFPADHLHKSVAQNLISRVDVEVGDDPFRQAVVVRQLEAEYFDWFGTSPPPREPIQINQ